MALLVRRLLWNKLVEQLLIGLAASLVIAGRMHKPSLGLRGNTAGSCRRLGASSLKMRVFETSLQCQTSKRPALLKR